MKVLVLVENYPSEKEKILMYVHVRNQYYIKNGIEVTVLNFRAKETYSIDGINVITLQDYKTNCKQYKDYILISHAPNLKHHYMFLKKYEKNFKNLVFFFHGHEIVKINKVYSKPYEYIKQKTIKKIIQNVYDNMKLFVWKKYYLKLANKSDFIFVSNSLYKEFLKWLKIDSTKMEEKVHIINNCVGEVFEKNSYDLSKNKKYDFITIRNNMDNSCYAIDIVNELAKNNPKYKFLVVGKGKYFQYNIKANNIIWMDKVLKHNEIIEFLNQSKCALMPTRRDTQGLMACEMATFGIPLITSNIPICREIFDDFKNILLLNNDDIKENDLQAMYDKMKKNQEKNSKYFYENTTKKEIELLKKINEE